MTTSLVTCTFCNKDRMTKRSFHRHGNLVVLLGRVVLVVAVIVFAVGVLGFLAARRVEAEMAVFLAGTLGLSLMMGLIGAFAVDTRNVNWCRTCGAVVEVMLEGAHQHASDGTVDSERTAATPSAD